MVTTTSQEREKVQVNAPVMTWIVIPCNNEGKNLQRILPAFNKLSREFRVLVVDDGSTDDTIAVCRVNDTACLQLPRRKGKGHAARAGCEVAFSRGATNAVLMDGDGEHDVEDAVKFATLVKGVKKTLIIHGYREERGKGIYSSGNRIITTILLVIHGVKLNDPLCGLKAFNHAAYREIRWKTSGYYMETEIAVESKRKGVNQLEIEILSTGRHKEKGTTLLTGIAIALEMLRHRLRLLLLE